jgi:hypothetical protein
LILMLSSSLFFLICSFHRNSASIAISRYFAVLPYRTYVLLMMIGCCPFFLPVKSYAPIWIR